MSRCMQLVLKKDVDSDICLHVVWVNPKNQTSGEERPGGTLTSTAVAKFTQEVAHPTH